MALIVANYEDVDIVGIVFVEEVIGKILEIHSAAAGQDVVMRPGRVFGSLLESSEKGIEETIGHFRSVFLAIKQFRFVDIEYNRR